MGTGWNHSFPSKKFIRRFFLSSIIDPLSWLLLYLTGVYRRTFIFHWVVFNWTYWLRLDSLLPFSFLYSGNLIDLCRFWV